ncbi:hypothetical protein R5R35_008626 [Gryllus longicercus]|uniref:Uncharacterized protein n=1 Tax=Gryllus longicercus TaxID=2509291 RepID=A0AAN9W0Y5_9ORTH
MKRFKVPDCMNSETTLKEYKYSKINPSFSAPEATRPPQTLEISCLSSNVGHDLSPNNSINITFNEAYKEQLDLNRKSPNESKTYYKAELLENEVTSNELLATTMKSEVPTLTEYPVGNSFKTECKLYSYIPHSHLHSIENNLSISASERELMQECNFPREQAHKFNSSRNFAQDVTNFNFTPVYPTALVPKRPRINLVHQQENKQVLKYGDIVPGSTQLQQISPLYSEEFKFNTLGESSSSNDNYHVNNTLVQKSPQQHQGSCNAHQPLTSSETPIHETHMIYATFDFNEQKTKDIVIHDISASEQIIKNKNSDSKSQENSPNEQDNIPYFNASTPEHARTPSSPSTIISFLNNTVECDSSPCNSKNLIPNKPWEEPLNLSKKSPNESNTYYGAKCEKINSSEMFTLTNLEVSTLTNCPTANSFKTESELQTNILHSQYDYIKNNPSTSATRKELTQELNPREMAEVVENFDYIPINPILLAPKLSRINWVRKLQRDKRQLAIIFQEISQLK